MAAPAVVAALLALRGVGAAPLSACVVEDLPTSLRVSPRPAPKKDADSLCVL